MTIVSDDGKFEWDIDEDRTNKRKHQLSFEEVLSVFDDPAFLEIEDKEHSFERGEKIRIINARRATLYEERIYNENYKKYFG